MYKFFKSLKLCVVVLMVLLASCKHDNLLVPKPNENIRPAADFIKNNYDFRLFYTALEYTGLVNELNGAGPFTILAVPDNGWNAQGITTDAQVRSLNKDSLRHALQYHVLKNRRWITTDFSTNGVDVRYETLAGEMLFVSAVNRNNDYFFDGARVVRNDIILSNGVMQVMNKFMQYHKGKTVQDYLTSAPEFSILVTGLKRFGLWDELSAKGPFTIFAPGNDAFEAKGITAETINNLNVDLYHAQRLFGVYIIYQGHFFVSDQHVFRSLGAEYNYPNILRNDTWYVMFGTSLLTTTPADRFFVPYPDLTFFKPGRNGFPEVVGMIQQNGSQLNPLVWYDHLCENGIVHRMHGVLAQPNDAIK